MSKKTVRQLTQFLPVYLIPPRLKLHQLLGMVMKLVQFFYFIFKSIFVYFLH